MSYAIRGEIMKLELKEVTKIYNAGDSRTYAVNRVNLEISSRAFIAITGDSGSGKSTLLNLIGGIDVPTGGDICIEGVNIAALESDKRILYRRKNIGFIFQDFNLVDFLNVQDNILLPLSVSGKKIDKELYTELLKRLEIFELTKKYPNMLSGGQKQRVAIARAVLMQPKLILADEPTGSLDSRNTENVFKLLKDLAQEFEQTVIMVTHNLDLAKRCDSVIVMKDGNAYVNQ